MIIIYSVVYLAFLPVAACYALYNAVRDRITEWRFKERYEVTEEGKLRTRKATEADLCERKIYRMVSPGESQV